jgi:hypothetical protein
MYRSRESTSGRRGCRPNLQTAWDGSAAICLGAIAFLSLDRGAKTPIGRLAVGYEPGCSLEPLKQLVVVGVTEVFE